MRGKFSELGGSEITCNMAARLEMRRQLLSQSQHDQLSPSGQQPQQQQQQLDSESLKDPAAIKRQVETQAILDIQDGWKSTLDHHARQINIPATDINAILDLIGLSSCQLLAIYAVKSENDDNDNEQLQHQKRKRNTLFASMLGHIQDDFVKRFSNDLAAIVEALCSDVDREERRVILEELGMSRVAVCGKKADGTLIFHLKPGAKLVFETIGKTAIKLENKIRKQVNAALREVYGKMEDMKRKRRLEDDEDDEETPTAQAQGAFHDAASSRRLAGAGSGAAKKRKTRTLLDCSPTQILEKTNFSIKRMLRSMTGHVGVILRSWSHGTDYSILVTPLNPDGGPPYEYDVQITCKCLATLTVFLKHSVKDNTIPVVNIGSFKDHLVGKGASVGDSAERSRCAAVIKAVSERHMGASGIQNRGAAI